MLHSTRLVRTWLLLAALPAWLTLSSPSPAPVPTVMQPASAPSPGPRWGHTLVWDAAGGEVLLFGGSRERGKYLADTWTWNGEGWRHHDVAGPPARGFAAVAFHEARGTVLLHGGRATGRRPHSDTWEWDGVQCSALGETGPYRADHHSMVFLPQSEQLLAFGGWNGTAVTGEPGSSTASGNEPALRDRRRARLSG